MKKRDINILLEMIDEVKNVYEDDLVCSIIGLEERPKIKLLREAKRRGFFDLDKCFSEPCSRGIYSRGTSAFFTHVPSCVGEYEYTEYDFHALEPRTPEELSIPARGLGEHRTGKVSVCVFYDGRWGEVYDLKQEEPIKPNNKQKKPWATQKQIIQTRG